MPNRIRYAILDHAGDDANLWELPWPLSMSIEGEMVEIHPRRTIDEVSLIELLREGHVEIYRMDDPSGPKLGLDEALAAVADDDKWNPGDGSGGLLRRHHRLGRTRIQAGVRGLGAVTGRLGQRFSDLVFNRLRRDHPFPRVTAEAAVDSPTLDEP